MSNLSMRQARAEAGLSQQELADAVGLGDVTGRGRGGMGVDVPDPPGIKTRPLQCQAQSTFLLRARRLGARHIEGVGGDGRAGKHG